MSKSYLVGILFFIPYLLDAQVLSQFGFTIGGTNYITDTNILFSKSNYGISGGLVTSLDIDDHMNVLLAIKYNGHRVFFVGKENETAIQEDVKFKLNQFEIPVTFNYYFLETEKIMIGANAGLSLNIPYNYELVDENKTEYLLEPLYLKPEELRFDEINEQPSMNTFAIAGLNLRYDFDYLLTFQYYYGLSDPYRKAPFTSRIFEIEGQDSYFNLAFTYFLPL